VAGAGLGQRRLGLAGLDRHLLVPLVGPLPLGVGDLDRDRRAQRAAVADAAHDGDVVLLEAHPGAAAVAQPPAGQLLLDVGHGHRQAGGQPLDDHHQPAAMGLTRGQEPKHGMTIPFGRRPTPM
jgi:hypothetical protein